MLEFTLAINENNLNQLQSKDLRNSLKKMLSAMAGMNKNQWQYAVNLNNIIVGELYKDDFDSQTSFAKAIGLDKSTVSRYVAAVRVMVNDITPITGLTMNDLPYSKAARISSVKDIRDFLNVTGLNLMTCTVRELEKAIKDYKASLEKADNVVADETEKETKAETEKEVPSFTGHYDDEKVWFEVNGTQFIIPLKDLIQYRNI